MSELNYQKWFTGNRMETSTVSGATPPINGELPDRDAYWSTATVTADATMVIGTTTHNAGDIMAFSDGHTIFNKTGNVMSGASFGNTGSIKSVPQAVWIVRVPDIFAQSIGGVDYRGKLFWVFANALHNGIRIGVIDMTQDNGLGEFKNYTESAQTPSGGLLGTLLFSERGIGGRLRVICKREMKGPDAQDGGFWVIAKQSSKSGVWTDNGWHAWPIAGVNASLFPVIDAGVALAPVVSNVGINFSGWGDSGPHGMVDATPLEISATQVNDHKLATIYRPTVGTDSLIQENDTVEVLTFNGTTGVISNPTTFITKGYDKGPVGWPAPIASSPRYYNLYACFSASSILP